jgi:hypothetical protein
VGVSPFSYDRLAALSDIFTQLLTALACCRAAAAACLPGSVTMKLVSGPAGGGR